MIKIKSVFTALLTSIIAVTSFAHRNPTVSLTLTDKALGYTFVLDKQRISISAFDKTGKLIWKANPMADSDFKEFESDSKADMAGKQTQRTYNILERQTQNERKRFCIR